MLPRPHIVHRTPSNNRLRFKHAPTLTYSLLVVQIRHDVDGRGSSRLSSGGGRGSRLSSSGGRGSSRLSGGGRRRSFGHLQSVRTGPYIPPESKLMQSRGGPTRLYSFE